MMWLNVGCGPHIAPAPWVNVDVVHNPGAGIVPGVLGRLEALPVAAGGVDRLYAGHCLEHIPIIPNDAGLSAFDMAMAEVHRALGPGGAAVFVCPDVYRAIDWYRSGAAPWSLVDACLEGPDDGIDPASAWDGCFHAFNCHEDRLVGLVRRTFPAAVAVPMDSGALDGWPVVSRAGWQCAVVTHPGAGVT